MTPKYRRARQNRRECPHRAALESDPAGISLVRELDPKSPPEVPACAVVGAGRLGTVLAAALSERPALRRDDPLPPDADVVLLCVPDGAIAGAARQVPPGPLLGHCSGATGLEPFAGRDG